MTPRATAELKLEYNKSNAASDSYFLNPRWSRSYGLERIDMQLRSNAVNSFDIWEWQYNLCIALALWWQFDQRDGTKQDKWLIHSCRCNWLVLAP